jgi:hypothetical protein
MTQRGKFMAAVLVCGPDAVLSYDVIGTLRRPST